MLHKGQIISIASILLIPLLILVFVITEIKNYYVLCVAVTLLSMIPFFVSLEKRKLKARELVIISSMIAISVAGRAAFFAVPQVKPMCAIVIITALVFGAQIGFATGSLSILISNFIFGQGMWTPFQMFGMGMCGLICGLIFNKKKSKPLLVAIVGALICFFVYGIIVDLSSVLMFLSEYSLKAVLSIYGSGVAFNAIHAASTFVFLLFFEPLFFKVLERIKIKYDLFGGAK